MASYDAIECVHEAELLDELRRLAAAIEAILAILVTAESVEIRRVA